MTQGWRTQRQEESTNSVEAAYSKYDHVELSLQCLNANVFNAFCFLVVY